MVLLDHLFWYLYSYTIIAKREAFQHIVYTVHFLKEMLLRTLKGPFWTSSGPLLARFDCWGPCSGSEMVQEGVRKGPKGPFLASQKHFLKELAMRPGEE